MHDIIPGPKLADTFGSFSNDAFLSNNNQIDSLLSGFDWTGTLHSPATNITYTITGPTITGFSENFEGALAAISRVANITFTDVPSSSPAAANADIIVMDNANLIQLAPTQTTSSLTDFHRFFTSLIQTKIQIYTNIPDEPSANPNDLIIKAMFAATGFAIGLKTPESGGSGDALGGLGPHLPINEATFDNTVMATVPGSASTDANEPQTLMPFDIQALQWLYGANMSSTGPATYKIDGSLTTQTVWNPVGASSFDSTGYTGAATFNLKQGMGSTVGQSNFFVAYGTHIGALDTGPGNDSITTNNLGDYIKTEPGNDTIQGGAGNDTIITSTGNSVIQGGKGNNILTGGYGNDTIFGQMGNDTMTGGTGKSNIYEFLDTNGTTGHDEITNFNPYGDKLEFSSKLFTSAAQAYAALGNNGVITLLDGGGGSITMVNISHNLLSTSDFIITT